MPALRTPAASVPAAPAATPSAQERLLAERVTASGMMRHVDDLARMSRPAGSLEFRAAAEYVVREATRAGFDARIQPVSDRRGTYYNVVAERAGTAPAGSRRLVIAGAHLDSVPRGPGANDNASGSAALLDIARAFEGIPTENDMRLMWFDGEERGLLGSRAYVQQAADLERAVAMLNADMLASPRGDVGFGLGVRTPNAVGDAIRGVAERNGIAATFRSERHSRSDHDSFDRTGIPAVHFGVSVRTVHRDDPNYHRPSDTPEKLNQQVLEQHADLMALSLYHFANQAERPAGDPPPGVTPIDGPPL